MRQIHILCLLILLILFSSSAIALNININSQQATRPSFTQPNLTNEQIIAWSIDALISVNTYSYLNYQSQFDVVRQRYFSQKGWGEFYESLQTSGNLKTVIVKQFSQTADIDGEVKIVQQGVLQNRYNWKIQAPFLIIYSDISGATSQKKMMATMQIERDPSAMDGISIKQLLIKQRE